MRTQPLSILSSILVIVAIVISAISLTSSELTYWGSGRLKDDYRGSGRVEIAYRGSGRLETDYRGSGRLGIAYRDIAYRDIAYRGSGRLTVG
jgi:hypothetical protein